MDERRGMHAVADRVVAYDYGEADCATAASPPTTAICRTPARSGARPRLGGFWRSSLSRALRACRMRWTACG